MATRRLAANAPAEVGIPVIPRLTKKPSQFLKETRDFFGSKLTDLSSQPFWVSNLLKQEQFHHQNSFWWLPTKKPVQKDERSYKRSRKDIPGTFFCSMLRSVDVFFYQQYITLPPDSKTQFPSPPFEGWGTTWSQRPQQQRRRWQQKQVPWKRGATGGFFGWSRSWKTIGWLV